MQLPADGFIVACFPHKIKGGSAGWTRAVALFDRSLRFLLGRRQLLGLPIPEIALAHQKRHLIHDQRHLAWSVKCEHDYMNFGHGNALFGRSDGAHMFESKRIPPRRD